MPAFHGMSEERWDYLMRPFDGDESIVLLPEEIEQGWHWCENWDGLLIHPSSEEFAFCTCPWMDKFRKWS